MKRLIKQNLRFYSKFLLFIGAMISFVCSFGVISYAWHENAEGNLASDNILSIANQSYTALGVNCSSSNGIITINGTATSSGPIYFGISAIASGTYTLSVFNNFISTDNNFYVSMRYSQTSQIADSICYCDTLNDSATFTSNTWALYLVVRVAANYRYDNVKIYPMLVSGSVAPLSYEPYGKIYYDTDNYTPVSKLYYDNLSKAYMSYYINGGSDLYSFGFVYNGVFGYASGTNVLPQWDNFTASSLYESKISSPYGMFYHTTWSIYDFIQEESDYPYSVLYQDKSFTLVYEFALPQDFSDSYFDLVGFSSINFYDVNGVLLYNNSTAGSFNVTIQGVRSIECILNNAGDIADENCYLLADVFAGYYNFGYQNGYAVGSSLNDSFYNSGYQLGYNTGMNDFMNGIYTNSNSYNYGFDEGYESGSGNSYNTGFAAGYAQARADTSWIDNSTANATDLFWTIGSTPWESFKHIWNINFLGINLANVITGFVTALIVIWLIKKVWK